MKTLQKNPESRSTPAYSFKKVLNPIDRAKIIICWIKSCKTLEQLAKCEAAAESLELRGNASKDPMFKEATEYAVLMLIDSLKTQYLLIQSNLTIGISKIESILIGFCNIFLVKIILNLIKSSFSSLICYISIIYLYKINS